MGHKLSLLSSLFTLSLLFPFLLSLLPPSRAFKDHEFKKCHDAHFCKRHRSRQAGSSTISLVSHQLTADGTLVAQLSNAAAAAAQLSLSIAAYSPGIIRLRVNEPPERKRFEVADILEPGLEGKRVALTAGSGRGGVGEGGDSLLFEFGGFDLVVRRQPVGLEVYEEGEMVMSWNGKGLFDFEHLREKQEGDEEGLWEESFHSHRDSKPKGPEAIGFDFTFHGFEHVYGIPERATSFSLQPTRGPSVSSEPYRLYNLDVFEYLSSSPFGLYASIPLMMAHNARRTAGAFWLNSAEMWVDVLQPGWDGSAAEEKRVDSHWIAESGILDLFLLLGPSPKDVSRQYAEITGPTALPQMFAIAYHQCRWNYKDEADVDQVDANFDLFDIPYDVIWLDIEHTDGKRYMTWDRSFFPNPIEMQNKIAAKGRKMVTIVDPHVKRDDGYALHREATNLGYYVKNANGGDFDGWCWPGSSSYLDVTSPAIRDWWATKFSFESYVGSTPILHIWNDMNEPSVFNGPEITMQKDLLHVGGIEHRDVHNAYGLYYHKATADGLLLRSGGRERPFVLSRAAFAGTQRIGPIWTGDNTAEWSHLRVSIPMLLALSVSGIAFSGADVGGFFGNPDAELMLRWYQLGVFYPFFRAHGHLDTKRREPWLFGEPYTSLIREAVRTRYSLLPYLYTTFKEASLTGVPVLRPLWYEFPSDAASFSRDDSFLLGASLLVHPVMEQGAQFLTVYFPGTAPWFHLKTGEAFGLPGQQRSIAIPVALDTMPVFQRAGTIVARKDRARRSSAHMEFDPYTLVIAVDSSFKADGELYIDDGKSYDFKSGAYLHRRFSFSNGILSSTDAAPPGSSGINFTSPCFVERIIVMGLPANYIDGNRRALIETTNSPVEEGRGPSWLRKDAPSQSLVLRAPMVPIASDWTIKVF